MFALSYSQVFTEPLKQAARKERSLVALGECNTLLACTTCRAHRSSFSLEGCWWIRCDSILFALPGSPRIRKAVQQLVAVDRSELAADDIIGSDKPSLRWGVNPQTKCSNAVALPFVIWTFVLDLPVDSLFNHTYQPHAHFQVVLGVVPLYHHSCRAFVVPPALIWKGKTHSNTSVFWMFPF